MFFFLIRSSGMSSSKIIFYGSTPNPSKIFWGLLLTLTWTRSLFGTATKLNEIYLTIPKCQKRILELPCSISEQQSSKIPKHYNFWTVWLFLMFFDVLQSWNIILPIWQPYQVSYHFMRTLEVICRRAFATWRKFYVNCLHYWTTTI